MKNLLKCLLTIGVATTLVACGGGGSGGSGGSGGTAKTNVAPVANAGIAQTAVLGSSVVLDGSASSDANGDTLTYAWTLTIRPAGSTATLTSGTSVNPTFAPDTIGTYVATLQVNDGKVSSTDATVAVTVVQKSGSIAEYSILHSFQGSGVDGALPNGSLTLGSDGNLYGMTNAGGNAACGTIFKITPTDQYVLLYSFVGGRSDGQTPYGTLTQGADGNFYGMTSNGGVNNKGTVFRVTPSGQENVLYSFAGAPNDAANPYGSLLLASDGNFYGMTRIGGANDLGAIFRITPGGEETLLYSFVGGTENGAFPLLGALIEGVDGNFYGMASSGGINSSGVIFKITPTGQQTVLHLFAFGNEGGGPWGSLTQGIDGNFYGVANFGGLNNATGTVFKITPNGEFTLLHTFTGGADGAFPSGSLLLGKDGDFYGTTAGQGAGEGTVFKITQTGVKTVLYTLKGAAEGRGSTSTPVMRSNGDLYGMTFMGGSNDFGVVFKLRP